jgi:hypothetical protein
MNRSCRHHETTNPTQPVGWYGEMNIPLPVILRLGEESSGMSAGDRAAGSFAALRMNPLNAPSMYAFRMTAGGAAK